MRKKAVILIVSLLFAVLLLSGCTSPDLSDPLGIKASTQMCVLGIIIFVILIILLLVGLARAGTNKNVVVQTPTQNYSHSKEDYTPKNKEKKESLRRCPECGRVIPEDANICPYCGKKFKNFFNEKDEEEKPFNEKKSEVNTKKEEKCPECGYIFEEEDLVFCPNCGVKLK